MLIVVLIIGVAAYMFMKKKQTPPVSDVPVVTNPPYPASSISTTTSSSVGFTPGLDPLISQTGPVKTGPILPQSPFGLQLTSAYGPDKTALPITSPSLYYSDPTRFTALSAGNCQCDDSQCCYWAPFQAQFGSYQTNYEIARKCVRIQYGDTPQACQQAFSLYQGGVAAFNVGMARALAARNNMTVFGNDPGTFNAMKRLHLARVARMMT